MGTKTGNDPTVIDGSSPAPVGTCWSAPVSGGAVVGPLLAPTTLKRPQLITMKLVGTDGTGRLRGSVVVVSAGSIVVVVVDVVVVVRCGAASSCRRSSTSCCR